MSKLDKACSLSKIRRWWKLDSLHAPPRAKGQFKIRVYLPTVPANQNIPRSRSQDSVLFDHLPKNPSHRSQFIIAVLKYLRAEDKTQFEIRMATFTRLYVSLVALLLVRQSAGHFYLNYPTSIGFDDALEGEAPCGSFTMDFATDNITNYHVGGDTLAMVCICRLLCRIS